MSRRILRYADGATTKGEFLEKTTKFFQGFARCDRVDMWLRDHDRYLCCRVCDSGETSLSFGGPEDGNRPIAGKGPAWEEAWPSVLLLTVRGGRRSVGFVRLVSHRTDYFPAVVEKLYQPVADNLGLAAAHVDLRSNLQERIKELTCLYGIARIAAEPDLWLDDVLQRVAERLPSAWLYPDIAGARILHDGRSYATQGYRDGGPAQRANIVIGGRRSGVVEVAYCEERPQLDEGPFLKEERRLLETVAEEIATIISRRETERKKLALEDQLRHADRLVTLGQLAAGVAHEMNEPLGVVVGFAQLARKCAGLPEQAGRDIDKVLAASLQTREIVKNLLAFTRQAPIRKMDVDVNRIVSEGLKFFEARCAKENVKVLCSLSPATPVVEGDRTQLTQVFVNLAANALQAMPAGGVLTVRTRRSRGYVFLAVEDTGAGMAREVLAHVFTPFFTTKEIGEGTGLGLPVAHGIVSAHGGALTITSSPGKGTRCLVRLPEWKTPTTPGGAENG